MLDQTDTNLDIRSHPSPSFNERKGDISMIVLHYTGMESAEAALDRLCDPAIEVSAHYMIEEDGRILQLVDDEKRAWHAGVACWKGQRDVNSVSIGVEIVNGGHDYGLPDFPELQIQSVMALVRRLMDAYGVLPENVVGHSDVAPGRKSDPGERFPWRRLGEAGLAVWPDDGPVKLKGVEEALSLIGYDLSFGMEAVLEAFQRRFRPYTVSGQPDAVTLAHVQAVCAQTLASELLTRK
jgi:N-acetylmuramoyl-L-alanine amidase